MIGILKRIWNFLFGKKQIAEQVTRTQEIVKVETRPVQLQINHFEFQYVDDLPNEICPGIIYIIGEKEFHWQLAMICPCGCNEIIQLNLLKDASPQWEFRITKKNKITIYPSVWRNKGCKSHFVLKNSVVNWIKPYKGNHTRFNSLA